MEFMKFIVFPPSNFIQFPPCSHAFAGDLDPIPTLLPRLLAEHLCVKRFTTEHICRQEKRGYTARESCSPWLGARESPGECICRIPITATIVQELEKAQVKELIVSPPSNFIHEHRTCLARYVFSAIILFHTFFKTGFRVLLHSLP